MKIGIIGDTHDHSGNIAKAIKIFNQQKVEYVLHTGDIAQPAAARQFAKLSGAKFIAVLGNCDNDRELIGEAIRDFGGEIYEESYTGQIGGKKIFMKHKLNSVEETAGSGEYDVVIYGHTHKQDVRKVGNTLVINPGQASGWWFSKSEVVVLELEDMSVETIGLKS